MTAERTWILDRSSLEAIGPVSEDVRTFAGHTLGAEGAGDVELALVEAVTNVVRHGYGPEGGPIRIEGSHVPDGLVLRIFDWGRPIPGEALAGAGARRFDFDPDDLEALPAGGMGLSLIAMLMDEVSYRCDAGQNMLRLRRGPRG